MTTTESDTKYCKKAVQVRKLSESDVDGQRIVFKFGRLLVKIHFRLSPIWRTAPKIDIFKSQ